MGVLAESEELRFVRGTLQALTALKTVARPQGQTLPTSPSATHLMGDTRGHLGRGQETGKACVSFPFPQRLKKPLKNLKSTGRCPSNHPQMVAALLWR